MTTPPYNSDQAILRAFDPTTDSFRTSGGSGGLLAGVEFDTITATYPNATTEVYAYRTGGVLGTINATVTVTYTDSTKDILLNVVKT